MSGGKATNRTNVQLSKETKKKKDARLKAQEVDAQKASEDLGKKTAELERQGRSTAEVESSATKTGTVATTATAAAVEQPQSSGVEKGAAKAERK